MSNIKLSGHTWDTSGIYDAEQEKTQKEVNADVFELKAALIQTNDELYAIREPDANLGYVTPFAGTKSRVGLSCAYVNEKQLKLWGTLTSWVSIDLLRGNETLYAGAPNFDTNLSAGTYTLKADSDSLSVLYGTEWSDRKKWRNGETITIQTPVCVFLRPKENNQNFGTSENPTIFNIEIYSGNVSIVPTAIDVQARNSINGTNYDRVLAHADFDYEKPYNIYHGTTFTAGKKVNYYTGNLDDNASGENYLATDYIEIDPTKEYLCVNIYITLSGETGEGLVTGGNRCWNHMACAFYDSDKNFITHISEQNASSKQIPTFAKYVRLTINSEAIIPYAVLFYGNYGQRYVRYRDYRKEIVEDTVYSATGLEKLNMVMFGDSITFGQDNGSSSISYVDFANDQLRSNIINCGLGGTRMSQGSPDTVGLASFASLCENIVSTDATAWDALDAYIVSSSHTDWAYQVAKLKAVDWSTIQAIGLWYGANDWHNNVPVGTEYNETTTNYDGACAYGLKKLLTKYPHLQVIIFTPIYRYINETTSGDDANGAGLNMDDYGASLKHVQTVFHCPVVDSGNELGINRYTIFTYTSTNDGTHPRKLVGLERIGKFFAESVKRFIAPY